jgi:A/G-specific adenine glycosylase
MLQQTTVAAVIPYWARFLDRFPDAAALAESREEDVLALWSGLGYYGRARALRRGAIAVMERHGGQVPGETQTLIGLPGVGRYTAGAIASVAFGRASPIVDGNVKRVFSRLFALRGSGASIERAYWSIAEALVPDVAPGDWNQALMELGATVCTPRAPRCTVCPVSAMCRALAMGTPEAFPPRAKRKATTVAPVAVAWIERRAKVLLVRRHGGSPLRGAWDLPAAVMEAGSTPQRTIARELQSRHGLRVKSGAMLAAAKHSILATRLELAVIEGTLTGNVPRSATLRWIAPDRLDTVAVSGATTKIARAVFAQRRSQDLRSAASSGSTGRLKA